MIDKNVFKEELYTKFPELKRIKKEHLEWPIVQKYNNKIYQQNKHSLFIYLEDMVNKELYDRLNGGGTDE